MTVETRFHVDRSEGLIVAERIQDVEDILENNKRLQNEPQTRDSSFRHTGTIPNVILEKWMNEEFARGHPIQWWSEEMDRLVQRKLRDPEWALLRTDNPSNPFYVGWGG